MSDAFLTPGDWVLPGPAQGFPNSYFSPPSFSVFDEIEEAREYQESVRIDQHPFFDIACRNPEALSVWAAQEAVVTGPFSQLLMLVGSKITNVHLRAVFLPVVTGEHHRLVNGIAAASHPWLLNKLCLSMKIDVSTIRPTPAVLGFLNRLEAEARSLMRGIGALAIGNERMLIPEYTAVRSCFAKVLPSVDYLPFLNANIEEDRQHTALLEKVAEGLVGFGHAPSAFLVGARAGVDARVRYYDDLVEMLS